jgi:uncharacterized protein YecT (DUF1311 family)
VLSIVFNLTNVRIIRLRIFSPMRPVARLFFASFFAASLFIVPWITLGLFAQDMVPASASREDCPKAVTTSAMRACENARYDAAEHELNTAYQSLLQHLDSGQKQKLRAAQRAWIRFRDANAEFQSSLVQGGTLAPLIKIGSLTEMTSARASELKKAAQP